MFAQITVICLHGMALLFGAAAVYSIAFPGPSGEWARLAVLAAYAFNVPVGIAGLSVGMFVRGGAKWLRAGCIALSLLVNIAPLSGTPDLSVAQLQALRANSR
jgi:hypothetical protein